MRKILPLALLFALGQGLPSCADGSDLLRARKITDRAELIGGDVAMADVGDFLLENDQMRVAILDAKDSPGPGVFGGSVVDIDVRRNRLGFEGAQGHDRFAESFPVANLLVPDPQKTQVSIPPGKDGKDGKEAVIRVEGEGAFLFKALSILRAKKPVALDALFPALKASLHFRTDYILRPGDRHITIQTTLINDKPADAKCAEVTCSVSCDATGFKEGADGCPTCDCEEPTPLDQYHEAASVFDAILGDYSGDPKKEYQAGVIAGDFVFFGAQNGVFAPPIGYDTERYVNEAFYAGQNTFKHPLSFDFVAASGGDVSYGYFTKPRSPDEPPTIVNVPLFTSAATAFLAAGKRCLYDASDDDTCDHKRAFTYERYLAVGDGDIASVAAEVWKTRGTDVGQIKGAIVSSTTGEPSPRAQVFIFQDLAPGTAPASIDELAETNTQLFGQVGLVDVIDADLGLDPVLDGDFHADLPPGHYVAVARSRDGTAIGAPERVEIKKGETTIWNGALPTPATLEYRITEATSGDTPAKITLIALDDNDNPKERDGLRRVYLGEGRLANGARTIEYSAHGEGTLRVEPGHYRLRVSRGPEHSVFEINDLRLNAGQIKRVDAVIHREVDTSGWMSTDMHLHGEPSFDSGMAFRRRVTAVVDENVEFAVPTDHDVVTDYTPFLRELFLAPYVATTTSAETTTIEQGHFIAFPMKYDATIVPTHGSYDPSCQGGGQILDGLRKRGDGITPLTIVAHPRDGFFGYIDQLNVDPFTLNRSKSLLEGTNPVFRTASCDFDAMEIINGKRFDLVRTATVEEVVDFNRCRAKIDAAKEPSGLNGICPQFTSGMLAPCTPGDRFLVCQHRNRSALNWAAMKRILTRTPEEQAAIWNFPGDMTLSQSICAVGQYVDQNGKEIPVPRAVADLPCAYRSGHLDDFFQYLEHGMVKTQVASSDSHSPVIEPGSPRTYFKSKTDAPASVNVADVVDSLRHGHAIATYGPFISADINGKSFGEVVSGKEGGKVTLNLRVQTASWFGVDRIEVYENGALVNVIDPQSKPQAIEDFRGKIELDVPVGRDSWVVIVAMGLKDENLMTPVYLDVPFGEIQLSKVTADAFALVPIINTIFKPAPILPDWYPIPAYAVTNPIFIDTKSDGNYDAPRPPPDFCSRPCQSSSDCGDLQDCLATEQVCGFNIPDDCEFRIPWPPLDH